MSPIARSGKTVENEACPTLDLGCGTIGPQRLTRQLVCGLDISFENLKDAMRRDPRLLVCGRGEQLPFRDGCFGLVRSNVSLPYMDIPVALREVKRVLFSGGQIWLSLHPLDNAIKELFLAICRGSVQNTFYRLYVLANGACFVLMGRLFRFPLYRKRCESFQTAGAMRRVLRTNGFINIKIERSKQFVVTAEIT
jgi:ubiquinone/menaquinone biosynthesis C-methylase UbiE